MHCTYPSQSPTIFLRLALHTTVILVGGCCCYFRRRACFCIFCAGGRFFFSDPAGSHATRSLPILCDVSCLRDRRLALPNPWYINGPGRGRRTRHFPVAEYDMAAALFFFVVLQLPPCEEERRERDCLLSPTAVSVVSSLHKARLFGPPNMQAK